MVCLFKFVLRVQKYENKHVKQTRGRISVNETESKNLISKNYTQRANYVAVLCVISIYLLQFFLTSEIVKKHKTTTFSDSNRQRLIIRMINNSN